MYQQSNEQDELASGLIKDFERMQSERSNYDSQCKEVAERMVPAHVNLFLSGGQTTQGEKKNSLIYDSTASIALNRFASILDSLLTPRNQTWHRILPSDQNLLKDRQTRLYFEEVNRLLFKYRYAPKANFASQNQQDYVSLGAYGTAGMFIDRLAGHQDRGIRYKSIFLGELYLKENHQGIVDGVSRPFKLTVRQAIQKWGKEKLPECLISAGERNPEKQFRFLHVVSPRADRDMARKDYKGMPFSSHYISFEGKHIIDEGGFTSFPYAVSRYMQAPNETNGRGPAFDVLPAVKTLNEQKKTLLKQGHRTVDPIVLAHDDGVVDTFSMKPGTVVTGGVSADGRALIHPFPIGNVQIGKELMDDERSVINDAFLITIFQILTENPQMTATEVMERTREKGILLAPTIGRQQSERLGPMVEREVDLLSSQGLLPPMPQALLEARGEFRLEYDSPLTRAQRAEEASGLMRTIESALSVVNVTQNPEPLDYFDWDKIIPELSDIHGVPAKWMRDPKMVMAMRQQRQAARDDQKMINAAPGAAAVMKASTKV